MTTTVQIEINDTVVDVDITFDDSIEFSITEDHLDVDISLVDNIDVELISETLNFDIKEEIINVSIDDCCLVSGGGSSDDYHTRQFNYTDDLAVGDLVTLSLVPNVVEKCINNLSIFQVIGIVKQILSPSIVIVLLWGEIEIENILDLDAKLFVSSTGEITNTLPDEGYVQIIGQAVNDTAILFKPESLRVKRLEI